MTAPATACDEFRPFMPGSVICDSCGHWKVRHQTAPAVDSDDGPEQSGAPVPPQGAPLQNTSPWPLPEPCDTFRIAHAGSGIRSAHAGPSTYESSYSCITCGHTGPVHWLPKYASPVAPAAPVEITAELHDTTLWDQALRLTISHSRLSMVLTLVLTDLDAGRPVPPHLLDMARDAIAKANEAIA